MIYNIIYWGGLIVFFGILVYFSKTINDAITDSPKKTK